MLEIANLPIVSVICPLYNAFQWLENGNLNDVLNQSFRNFELILVDDGSNDSTYEFIVQLQKKDQRIIVLHQTNGGGGAARNAGLDIAKGKYVFFFDIDDEIDINLIGYCVQQMEHHSLDMMIFSYEAITKSQKLYENVIFKRHLIESNDQLKTHFIDELVMVRYGNGFVWNKFYRRSFLEKCKARFPEQHIQEDEIFNLRLYPYVERMLLSSEVLYHYFIRGSGNIQSRFFPNLFDMFVNVRNSYEQIITDWIGDGKLLKHVKSKFYREVDITIRFNLLHPNCVWNQNEKKKEFHRVMSHPYTQEAMVWAKQNLCGLENRMYLQAYRHKSLYLITLYSSFFFLLRRMKHNIAKK